MRPQAAGTFIHTTQADDARRSSRARFRSCRSRGNYRQTDIVISSQRVGTERASCAVAHSVLTELTLEPKHPHDEKDAGHAAAPPRRQRSLPHNRVPDCSSRRRPYGLLWELLGCRCPGIGRLGSRADLDQLFSQHCETPRHPLRSTLERLVPSRSAVHDPLDPTDAYGLTTNAVCRMDADPHLRRSYSDCAIISIAGSLLDVAAGRARRPNAWLSLYASALLTTRWTSLFRHLPPDLRADGPFTPTPHPPLVRADSPRAAASTLSRSSSNLYEHGCAVLATRCGLDDRSLSSRLVLTPGCAGPTTYLSAHHRQAE